MDLRSIGILFYVAGPARTVSEALANLGRYSATTNEALVVEISRRKDEITLALRGGRFFIPPRARRDKIRKPSWFQTAASASRRRRRRAFFCDDSRGSRSMRYAVAALNPALAAATVGVSAEANI
jgi:hypothetical protein